jgi:hypothetical protein
LVLMLKMRGSIGRLGPKLAKLTHDSDEICADTDKKTLETRPSSAVPPLLLWKYRTVPPFVTHTSGISGYPNVPSRQAI